MQLTESQIEAAAMALYAKIGHLPKPWDELDQHTRENYRRAAGALEPYMEPCWDMPNGIEMDDFTRLVDNAERLGGNRSTSFALAMAAFIQNRNRKIQMRAGIRAT